MYPPIPLSFFWAERFRGVGGATRIFKISVEGTFTIAPSYSKQVFILQVCEEGKTVNIAFVQFFSTMNCQMFPQIGAKANTK